VPKVLSSGGSEFELNLTSSKRQVQINVDIAGYIKTSHWTKRDFGRFIRKCIAVYGQMEPKESENEECFCNCSLSDRREEE
jgi:hypothetical protein